TIIATSACSKAGDPEEGGVTIEKGRLAFILPDAGRAVTYAPGIDAENGADNDLLGIYMFDADDKFISLTTRTYSDGTQESEGRKFTVSVTGTGERRFVFVKVPSSHSLPSINPGDLIGVLASAVTTPYTTGSPLTAPFVMSNALASDQPYVKVTDIESQSNDITVSLKRRVARFDVIAEGIDITNVSIANAAPTGRILDHSITVAAPLAGGLTYQIAGSALANTGTSFYLYPTTLGAGSTGTVITVTTAESKTYSITLASDQPIDANKLYRIMVTQSATGSDLTFKLVVADWTDADNLPTFEEGSVSLGFNPVVSSSNGVSTSSDGYSIVDYSEATGAASAQLYYVSASNAKPQATVEALHGTHAGAISVGISNPVQVSYAGTPGYMSTVTITMPITKVPVDLKVRLTGTTGDKDSVSIISVPDYTDSRYAITPGLKPVLAGGRYWAPVNVGATELAVSTASTATLAQGGYYFQWGRNTPLAPETDGNDAGKAIATVNGPVASVVIAESAEYANKGIGNASGNLGDDWLSPRNDGLWTGANAQGPCPDGWRVVTLTDSDPVTKAYGGKGAYISASDRRFRFAGDNPGEYLYFAPRGYYRNKALTVNNGSSWLGGAGTGSTVNETYAQFIYLQENIVVESYVPGVSRGLAMPVRCVQQ
ncbi:MAG: FimB/Mfa2 family fimbrial subunit, partial [Tannerellaceae bacterium]|nr:FimB/Mfa2 family fimbrial subunit [Tannerellaceae bacterium]